MKTMRKLTALLLGGAMVLSLAACGTGTGDNSPAPTGSAPAEPQTYTATAKGYGGDVTVTLTVTGSTVDSLTVEGAGETEAIGGAAITGFNETFAGYAGQDVSQVAEVDAVSGATLTSDAVRAAAADCIAQAKGEENTAEVKMAPGTYVGQGTGFRVSEPVTVSVTVSEDEILEIEVDQVNTSEKAAILQSVVDLMLPRVLEYQSVAVDAITGATASSNGVKQAITDALTQALEAGGSDAAAISAFQTTPPKSTETVTLDTEVLVVGGGTGGLFVMETQGEGDVLIAAFGDILELEVAQGSPITIDNEHVVAWDASLDYAIRVASGTFGFTSGEGLVNEFTGNGKVYIQTRNVHNLADALRPFFPSSSNS